jgi:hypothetical protein
MFAMMLAMLALMAVMGVGLSRLMITTKATTQMQRTQDNKQLLSSLVMTLSSKAADSDGDFVLEPQLFLQKRLRALPRRLMADLWAPMWPTPTHGDVG